MAVTAVTLVVMLGRQNPAWVAFMMGSTPTTNKEPVMYFSSYRINTYNTVKTSRPFELKGIVLNRNETER